MGVLDWLGLRRKKQLQAEQSQRQQQVQEQVQAERPRMREELRPPIEVPFRDSIRTRLTDEDLENMLEKHKINNILKIVTEMLDELKPPDENGTRVSRLALLLEQSGKGERATVRKILDQLDVDELILKYLRQPLLIEEVSRKIGKTYGYTASRLRILRRMGKVTRFRDQETNKYKYTRVRDIGKTLGLEQTRVIGVGSDSGHGFSGEVGEDESAMMLDDEADEAKASGRNNQAVSGDSSEGTDYGHEGTKSSIFRKQKDGSYGSDEDDDEGLIRWQ